MSTTISLKKETVERLKEHGMFGESWNEMINRILDRMGEGDKKAESLMWVIHWLKHNGGPELYEEMSKRFPYWREVEVYNSERHPSATRYLFDTVLAIDRGDDE